MLPVRFTTLFIFFVITLGLNAQITLNIDVNQERTAMSENLMGVFFEDINYAADGGLYAELIQNRSFEYYPVSGYTSIPPLTAWALVKENGANATMHIDDAESLKTNNTKYLRLSINSETGKAGIRNTGFDGILLRNGEKYNFSVYLKRQLSYNEGFDPASSAFEGSMGLGTWNTQARFDDIQIVSGEKVIYEEEFSEGSGEWEVFSGSFSINSESYIQTSNAEPALSKFSAFIDSSEYTITLKAMKTGGREGFLIPFAMKDANNYYWFNIAGWANTQHAIEQVVNGSKNVMYTSAGNIQNNHWYTIKIEVNASGASCWLDDDKLFDIPAPTGPVTASVVEDTESNDLIVKLVNSGNQTIQSTINIEGIDIDQQAKLTFMSGEPDVRNSISSPNNIVPEVRSYRVANTFNYTLPPYSFHVFRINKANGSWSSIKDMKQKNQSMLKIVPNPSDGFTQIYFDNPHSEAFDLYLYDTMGQLMLQKLNTKNNSFTIEESSLPSGIYLVSVKNKNRDYTGRLVMN